MTIVVTGGAGFIGSNLLRYLVPRHPEHEFVNVDKLTYAANLANLDDIAERDNYRFVRADVADPLQIVPVLDQARPEIVIHLAAESHVDRSIRGPSEFVRTNVVGTLELLRACTDLWPSGDGLFFHVSTDEVYGSLGDTGRFTEASRYDPSSPYAASKASSDHLVRAFHRTYGLPVMISNCSNNYGPYQFPEKLIPLMILQACAGRPLPIYGDGRNVRDWLFVEDHCRAIWSLIRGGEVGQTYNIGGGAEVRNVDVVDAICGVIAEETEAELDELLALKEYVPDRQGHDWRYAIDASRIREATGWAPSVTFEEGLRHTVRWYLRHDAWTRSVQTGAYAAWMAEAYPDAGA